MSKVLWIDAVGLTPGMIGPETPHLKAVADRGFTAPMTGILPGVTCAAQSTLLTGKLPRDHGIVGNGWYFREQAEVWLWRQSNRLVQGEKLWHRARRDVPGFSVCNMFWWYNMYADVDWSLTPRPLYFADGRKLPGIYGRPLDFRRHFEREFEPFPLFNFWGPAANLSSSRWIVQATIEALRRVDATLTLCYVPHLDYDLQRHGPDQQVLVLVLQRELALHTADPGHELVLRDGHELVEFEVLHLDLQLPLQLAQHRVELDHVGTRRVEVAA